MWLLSIHGIRRYSTQPLLHSPIHLDTYVYTHVYMHVHEYTHATCPHVFTQEHERLNEHICLVEVLNEFCEPLKAM